MVTLTATAAAAPNVASTSQKGSLLLFPDIRIDTTATEGSWNTLVRIQNDGGSSVTTRCYWMDGNRNRAGFSVPVTPNQAIWFDARTGQGTLLVNPFPQTAADGLDNPFLAGPWPGGFIAPEATNESNDSGAPYGEGLLACWAVDTAAEHQVKWNHLSGTATVYNALRGAYEYNAHAFVVPTGFDLAPVAPAGTLRLDGVTYDACPTYLVGQFTPFCVPEDFAPGPDGDIPLACDMLDTSWPVWALSPGYALRLAVTGCTLSLVQDVVPAITTLQFEVWNEDEVKFTGAHECADTWHETAFQRSLDATNGGPLDAAAQNFHFTTLGTIEARYRVQARRSSQCDTSEAFGLLGMQSERLGLGLGSVGTPLMSAGKQAGRITWDPASPVPERATPKTAAPPFPARAPTR
jgi:hypothetical protein